MKLIPMILLLALTARGGDINPVLWYDAATNAYTVACYWAQQFPQMKINEKHVLVVSPKTSWDSKPKQDAVKLAVTDMLSGKSQVTSNSLSAVSTSAGDAAVKMVATDDPQATLTKMGLSQPKTDDIGSKTNAVITP